MLSSHHPAIQSPFGRSHHYSRSGSLHNVHGANPTSIRSRHTIKLPACSSNDLISSGGKVRQSQGVVVVKVTIGIPVVDAIQLLSTNPQVHLLDAARATMLPTFIVDMDVDGVTGVHSECIRTLTVDQPRLHTEGVTDAEALFAHFAIDGVTPTSRQRGQVAQCLSRDRRICHQPFIGRVVRSVTSLLLGQEESHLRLERLCCLHNGEILWDLKLPPCDLFIVGSDLLSVALVVAGTGGLQLSLVITVFHIKLCLLNIEGCNCFPECLVGCNPSGSWRKVPVVLLLPPNRIQALFEINIQLSHSPGIREIRASGRIADYVLHVILERSPGTVVRNRLVINNSLKPVQLGLQDDRLVVELSKVSSC